ncbi:hypothetical protein [Flavobacterium aquidurense]|uniref:hypothetical protein n=1 Tax=Flavobacterium aquidurense TaxID=362413 RepID=UPI0028614B0A|nr:hypothetical protein [Flavobacterium aquidurense]MDR7371308.1 hypothetical protein [Flavobacterium aquidurense]
MKETFKIVKIFLFLLLTISCKNEIKKNGVSIIKEQNSEKESQNINNSLSIPFLNKNLLEIVKIGNEFKLSCSEKSNKVNLKSNSLFIEIVEPTKYDVEKIEESNDRFKIYLKGQLFYYDVILIDRNLGIYYWKNLLKKDKKIDSNFSFYTIEEVKLKTANLEKENCDENNEISNWIGEYYLELSSTHGDNKETIDKYRIVFKDLKNIEFSSNNHKYIISGEFFDEKTIQGDISKNDKNEKSAITSISPFLSLIKDGDNYYVTCPLITQGAGFSSTPYEIKKVK